MSDEEAVAKFAEIRWADNASKPYCPHCGSVEVYGFRCRPIWRCKDCRRLFSMTSGTLFHSRNLSHRDYLLAIAIFVNGVKGHSALQLSRDLDCQYKTAFVLAHKLREAIGAEVHNPDQPELSGEVAVDGKSQGRPPRPTQGRGTDR
jgi:transposase-like protein